MNSVPAEVLRTLASLLSPPDWLSLGCASHVGVAIGNKANWQPWCQAAFGRGCLQYLRFLCLETSATSWRSLYLRLSSLHQRLYQGNHRNQPPLGMTGRKVRLSLSHDPQAPCALQDGHGVIYKGSLSALSVFPLSADVLEKTAATLPIQYLDVVPLSQSEVLVVTRDVCFERWVVKAEGNTCTCKASHLQTRFEKTPSAIRLFVEHVACRVFIFSEGRALAFELSTLTPCYEVSIHYDVEDTTEVLARWDYGQAFLMYKEGGHVIHLWETTTGSSHGCIKQDLDLICCDLTRANPDPTTLPSWLEHSVPVVVALGVDGHIRLYRLQQMASDDVQVWVQRQWEQFAEIRGPQIQEVYVEVKLEGPLVLAVSHGEAGGSVHLWDLSGPKLQPVNKRRRRFSKPPDRIEARHGGAFIEVCFPCAAGLDEAMSYSMPVGVFDVMWLDPRPGKVLAPLFILEQSIGDWRCDIRDWISVVWQGDEEDSLVVVARNLWPTIT